MAEKTQTETEFTKWLESIIQERHSYPSNFAKDLGISHATVSRWLHGKDIPKTKTCRRIAELTGYPISVVMAKAGHLPPTETDPENWPPFREYMAGKYPPKDYPLASVDLVDVLALGLERHSK